MNNKNKTFNMPVWSIFIIVLIIIILIEAGIRLKNNLNEKNIDNNLGDSEKQNSDDIIRFDRLDNTKIENGNKINISNKLTEEKKIENLSFTNASLESKDNSSYFKANITNNGENFKEKKASLKFYNNDNIQYASLDVIIPGIESGKSIEINAEIQADITNSYDYSVEFYENM